MSRETSVPEATVKVLAFLLGIVVLGMGLGLAILGACAWTAERIGLFFQSLRRH